MKKIVFILSLLLINLSVIMAQQLATETFSVANSNLPSVGANFDVPVNISGFPAQVRYIEVVLNYDPLVLNYTDVANLQDPGTSSYLQVTFPSSGQIKINYNKSGFLPFDVFDGKLFDIQFDFLGGDSPLNFDATSRYRDMTGIYFITAFVSGSVSGGYYSADISGGDWNTPANWSTTVVPNTWANVTVASGAVTTIGAAAMANDLTIAQGGQLTSTSALNVAGDFTIESDASGSGSFINNGTLTGTTSVTVENYLTTGNYHGISMPVSGETSSAFMGAPSAIYLKTYDEGSNSYTNIVDYGVALNPSQGYMIKVESGAPYTPTYTGSLNASGSYATTFGGLGYNFVGNPFTSAIDWNAASGWTKTGLGATIWVYNNGNWATWNGTTSVNGGSRYIAMNQGFFVQASSAGSLAMTKTVCTHNGVAFREGQTNSGDVVRLQVEANGMVDESVVLFMDGATVDYDSDFDSHKLFSFNPDYPQLFSTANDLMAINALPTDYHEAIPMDVRGANGNTMTISAIETAGFEELYLQDNASGAVVNLIEDSYSFDYNADITDRFTLLFSVTDVEENALSNNAKVFAYDNTIQVVLSGLDRADVTVYNLLGQAVDTRTTNGTITRIPVQQSGYYLVKVSSGTQVSTQKVFIK